MCGGTSASQAGAVAQSEVDSFHTEASDIPHSVDASNNQRIFLRCCLLSLSVIMLATCGYVAIVTVVDPRQQLLSTSHIFPAVTLNSRSIKLELFQKYNAEAPVTGLIMGSSSSLKMSPEVFQQITRKRFFNTAVFMGTPRDYLAQYRLLKGKGAQFKVLIIGIDVIALREAPEWNELKSNWAMQTALDPRRTGPLLKAVHWLSAYRDTFSAAYAHEVSRSIRAYRRNSRAMVFVPDGRIDYLGWDRDVALYPNRDAAISSCTDENIGWISTLVISAKQESALEQLIREALNDGADIRLWITPYHPNFFDRLATSPKAAGNMGRVRSYLNGLRDQFGIRVFDLSDEASFGGDREAWYNCSHFRDANARLVTNMVMGNASNVSVHTTTKKFKGLGETLLLVDAAAVRPNAQSAIGIGLSEKPNQPINRIRTRLNKNVEDRPSKE
jgi:hypothetical protein